MYKLVVFAAFVAAVSAAPGYLGAPLVASPLAVAPAISPLAYPAPIVRSYAAPLAYASPLLKSPLVAAAPLSYSPYLKSAYIGAPLSVGATYLH